MPKISIGNGLFALVDEDDYENLRHYQWRSSRDMNGKYRAYTSIRRVSGKSYTLFMSRAIMLPRKDQVVDHISGNTLDNRRENLRSCTKGENNCNRGSAVKNSSGFKGVASSRNSVNPWVARIRVKGKEIHLGHHKTAELAAIAYDKAAIKIQGEYARPNLLK